MSPGGGAGSDREWRVHSRDLDRRRLQRDLRRDPRQAPYDLGQDKAIRQAIVHAIDKEAIVQGVWQGNAEVGRTMIPPAILGPAGDQIVGGGIRPGAGQDPP